MHFRTTNFRAILRAIIDYTSGPRLGMAVGACAESLSKANRERRVWPLRKEYALARDNLAKTWILRYRRR